MKRKKLLHAPCWNKQLSPCNFLLDWNKLEHQPKSAFFPFSSGRKRLSTAQTRMCSGMLGDLAPTSSNPKGTSIDSVAMETRRRSFPA